MNPRQVAPGEAQTLRQVLELIKREFAYMDGVVDPPSSIHRLTVDELVTGPGEVWVIGAAPLACVVMTARAEVLYVGKLAVAESERGAGLARVLLNQAEVRAGELGLPWLELQVRIELEANHRAFTAMGFVEAERTPHPGYTRPTSITFRRPVSPEDPANPQQS